LKTDLKRNCVTLKSDNLVKDVYIHLDDESKTLHWSDNFYDLLPNQEKEIYLENDNLKEI